MAQYPGATRAFTGENRTEANNSQGSSITQEISTENEEGQTIGGGLTVGYEVENATPSKADRNAISGLTVTGATDHSLKLTWNGNLPKDGTCNYGLAMVNGNGTLSDWQVVPAGSTSYEWGKDSCQLSPSTEYRFVIAPVTGDTNNTAKQADMRSAVLTASTLPKGDVLTMNGLEVISPKTDTRNVKVSDGGTPTMRETATYLTHDANGKEVYAAPKFTWYRMDPHGTQATRVGAGKDLNGAKLASSKDAIDQYLSADSKLTDDATPHTSTYSRTPVTADDDGSVWYCNVSYNNVVVASQRATLDVMNTVETLDKTQASGPTFKRNVYLKANQKSKGFTRSKGQSLKHYEASTLTQTATAAVTIGNTINVSFPGAAGKVSVTSSKSKVRKCLTSRAS
jgi:hypothetical protein